MKVTILKLYLTLLTCAVQTEHWPEAKRFFKPIDIEYLSCECRKYYSYVNGTKKFEGKNVFKPGKSPMLPFEIPLLKDKSTNAARGRVQSQVVVIAGAPCSGKSSLVKQLEDGGYRTVPETAEVSSRYTDQMFSSFYSMNTYLVVNSIWW